MVGHNCTHGGADKCLFSWDARKRYLQKLRIGGIGLPDPFGIDEGLWSEDVKRWPTMEFGDLYSYLVNTEGTYTKKSLKAYKSLEAYNYFFNGYVRTVYYYDVGSTSDCERSTQFCILKALVNPSQRAMQKPNEAWVIINRTNGTVETAHCNAWLGKL